MSARPPPIPELAYQRVMSVAKVDGYSILLFAGMGALSAAAQGEYVIAIAACLAAGTGAMEIHGMQLLHREDESGVNWLVRAQLLLMLVILAYATYSITHIDADFLHTQLTKTRALSDKICQAFGVYNVYQDIPDAQFMLLIKGSYNLAYAVLGFVTCLYQGLMARYYHKRRGAIAQALDNRYASDVE